MTQELQNFLILVCLLMCYPIVPIMAWQERGNHPTLATIVIALWVFVVPVFVIGFSSTLWAGASRIITAPFSATFSHEPSSDPVFQQTRIRLRYTPRWDI
jgi:drug/metabolite transporter (DMT)-like permease